MPKHYTDIEPFQRQMYRMILNTFHNWDQQFHYSDAETYMDILSNYLLICVVVERQVVIKNSVFEAVLYLFIVSLHSIFYGK